MTAPENRSIRLEIPIAAHEAVLLQGLEAWIALGLISEAKILQIARTSLSCLIPEPLPQQSSIPSRAADAAAAEGGDRSFLPDVSQPRTPARRSQSRPPARAEAPSLVTQVLQSFMAELSLRWLLFLGVFLVVVSSGVLAATQWTRFPAVGQYGVLAAYTVVFWAVGRWAARQANLRLTARTLHIAVLLLVPVNFWAMDSFDLWQQPWEWLVVLLAAVGLSGLAWSLRSPPAALALGRWPVINLLGLAYLHWGWRLDGMPLVAVYVGTVGTTLFTFWQQTRSQTGRSPNAREAAAPALPPLAGLLVIYALVLLLGRAIVTAQLPLAQLGLALGICGTLLAWLAEQQFETEDASWHVWELIGGLLLLGGWLVSVTAQPPWQALLVSASALWLLHRRLGRFWQVADLLVLLLVRLQIVYLAWLLLPQPWRDGVTQQLLTVFQASATPWALIGPVMFPYIWAVLRLRAWLAKNQQRSLASLTDWIALGMSTVLFLISVASPSLRLFNLLQIGVTLLWELRRRGQTQPLVSLTHAVGLLIGAMTLSLLTNLGPEVWAVLAVSVTLLELWFSVGTGWEYWRVSAGRLALILSGVSYLLLLPLFQPWLGHPAIPSMWSLIWLLVPGGMTLRAARQPEPERWTGLKLSVGALGAAQLLFLGLPRLHGIGLLLSAGLLLWNTVYWRSLWLALVAVGGVVLGAALLIFAEAPLLSWEGWLLIGALAVGLLSALMRSLIRYSQPLAQIYGRSAEVWADMVTFVVLLSCATGLLVRFTVQQFGMTAEVPLSAITAIALAGLLVCSFWRRWGAPTDNGVYQGACALELLVIVLVQLQGGSVLAIAAANGALALALLGLTEVLQRRRPVLWSVRILPLLSALLALGFRAGLWTSWTGGLFLVAGVVGLSVMRQRDRSSLLTYASLAACTLGWYELVIYRLSQMPGGSPADGLVVLALVAGAIAALYQAAATGWVQRRDRLLGLTAAELSLAADLHWVLGSVFLMLATSFLTVQVFTPDQTAQLIGLGLVVGAGLSLYALLRARQIQQGIWVYLGVAQAIATLIYVRLGWPALRGLDPWWAAIAAGVAVLLIELPWERWGWPARPWFRSAAALPAIALVLTLSLPGDVSLLIVAASYFWMAQRRRAIRLTYGAIAVLDFWALRWLLGQNLTSLLFYVALVSLPLLYVAQVDPALRRRDAKGQRHALRTAALGLLAIVALVNQQTGLVSGGIGLVAVLLGLALRVRAYLYIGTLTFVATVFYQLVVLIGQYPFSKWIIGLTLGIFLIWLAATFETRREQVLALVRNWLQELEAWD